MFDFYSFSIFETELFYYRRKLLISFNHCWWQKNVVTHKSLVIADKQFSNAITKFCDRRLPDNIYSKRRNICSASSALLYHCYILSEFLSVCVNESTSFCIVHQIQHQSTLFIKSIRWYLYTNINDIYLPSFFSFFLSC